MAKPRLFVEALNARDDPLRLEGDAHHYLARVMRMKPGEEIAIFDGRSDSLNARIAAMNKQSTELEILSVEKPFLEPPALTLAFAPIKKARTDFIVEKAAEMGARWIQPMMSAFTNSERVRVDRLARHAIEAIEQCGGNFVPEVLEPKALGAILDDHPDTQWVFCDETAPDGEGRAAFLQTRAENWGILIGPEGGFSEKERALILQNGALRLSLGPRILRADTAAVAALALWQSTHGDWQ